MSSGASAVKTRKTGNGDCLKHSKKKTAFEDSVASKKIGGLIKKFSIAMSKENMTTEEGLQVLSFLVDFGMERDELETYTITYPHSQIVMIRKKMPAEKEEISYIR